jgi:hypothetical protein
MADEFKMCMHSKCAVGGLYCKCCNDYLSDKEKLRRAARRLLKAKVKKEVNKS